MIDQTITTPTGRVIHINYPTPKFNPIVPAEPDAEITRMDFLILEDGVIVNKLGAGYYGKLVVIRSETKAAFDLNAALAWCAARGWIVRRWPGGARAWKYKLEPVRSRAEIQRLRDELRNQPRPDLEGQGVNLDLAYDL